MQNPTDQQLQATYAREAPQRPHWPRTYAQAMENPLIARLLALLTTHPPAINSVAHAHPARRYAWGLNVQAPLPTPRKPYSTPPGAVDLKRRAAGDTD